jgi:hypothetical protein
VVTKSGLRAVREIELPDFPFLFFIDILEIALFIFLIFLKICGQEVFKRAWEGCRT